MSLFSRMLDALHRERHSVTIEVTIPNQLFMALETLIYLRNELPDDKEPVDRDFIIGIALSKYVAHHLTKNEKQIVEIPPAPPKIEQFSNGRKQARYQSYQEAQP